MNDITTLINFLQESNMTPLEAIFIGGTLIVLWRLPEIIRAIKGPGD